MYDDGEIGEDGKPCAEHPERIVQPQRHPPALINPSSCGRDGKCGERGSSQCSWRSPRLCGGTREPRDAFGRGHGPVRIGSLDSTWLKMGRSRSNIPTPTRRQRQRHRAGQTHLSGQRVVQKARHGGLRGVIDTTERCPTLRRGQPRGRRRVQSPAPTAKWRQQPSRKGRPAGGPTHGQLERYPAAHLTARKPRQRNSKTAWRAPCQRARGPASSTTGTDRRTSSTTSIGFRPAQRRFRREENAMAKHRARDSLYLVRRDVVATTPYRQCPGCPYQCEASSRRSTNLHTSMTSRRFQQCERIVGDAR